MDILKQNKFLVLFLSVLFLSLESCQETTIKNYKENDCDSFVASRMGLWIEINSKNFEGNDLNLQLHRKKIDLKKVTNKSGGVSFFIDDVIKLNDTLKLSYHNKNYEVYNFSNTKEIVTNGGNGKKMEICRVSTAIINGKIIKDCRNNILKIAVD